MSATHHTAPGHTTDLPTRTATQSTGMSDEDVIPSEDTSEVTKLFTERLQAYKHATVYLEDYVQAVEKLHSHNHKEYEKVLKTISHPIKEADHFDQQPGGIQSMLENMRQSTQAIANSNNETAKVLKTSVLPVFERLHSEIKQKTKELTKGAGKGNKAVDKARSNTQKHIELLGKGTSTFGSSSHSVKAAEDPYVVRRGVMYRLGQQVNEENANRADLIEVQNSFAQFEAHVIETMQQGMQQFQQVSSKQDQYNTTTYTNMVQNISSVPPNFEWNSFLKRRGDVLIDPSAPPRSADNIAFPGQDHAATKPLIAGGLERKGKLLKKYDTGYYVVTPSKYLHEFKTDDDFGKDPTPVNSLYLPDCTVGGLDGLKFAVKGKDSSSKLSALSMSHEYQFKARTPQEAAQWHQIIGQAAGVVTNEKPEADDDYVDSPVSGSTAGLPAAGVAGTTAATHPAGTTGAVHPAGTTTTTAGSDALHPTAGVVHDVPATSATTGMPHTAIPGESGLGHTGAPATGLGHTPATSVPYSTGTAPGAGSAI